MDNIENNKNTIFYKNIVRNFNIVIGISFIMLVSIIYITSIFNVHIPQLNSNTDLGLLESILTENFIYYTKIFFSFLMPLTFFIFMFLFVLNPISLKSLLISFVLIFLTAFYLYKLPYNILIEPVDNLDYFIKLIIHIIAANFIMLFIVGLGYIRYDVKKLYTLSDFYTMISEIVIWSLLILFIISLIASSVLALFYFNGKIEIKSVIKFLLRNDMKKLKILMSIFIVLKVSIIYFSYVIYNKMVNTKLSINISRVLSLFISAFSIFIIVMIYKYNLFNHHYNYFLLLACFVLMVFFVFNMILFRIDKEAKIFDYIMYIIANIAGLIFSILILVNCINKFSEIFIIIFNIIIIINFLYNILFCIMKKYIKFIFLYNYLYIIFLFISLFY
ncbi:hypothetical protein [uncultured Brachyspira sp.]|uniref:hypothetical protein n=1 Tax=uncultured Brachyspira sp. TaxID=221953 RepID=UPI00261D4883|nr:hypothetical protein [uncultured Brachyspira sp.]